MMKLLLIEPGITDFYSSPKRMSALGMISIFKALPSSCDVKMLFMFKGKGKTTEIPNEMSYLMEFVKDDHGPLSFFSSFKKFSKCPDVLRKFLLDHKPDVVGISVFSVCYYQDIVELTGIIKSIDESIFIILGGTGASSFPGIFSKISSIDLIIKGNNIENIVNFIMGWESFRKDRVIDSGFCTRADMITGYPYRKYPVNIVMTRGCPNECSFCSVYDLSGKKFMVSSPDKLNRYLAGLPLSSSWINFEDDNISCDISYFNEILDIIIKTAKRRGVNYGLTFMNGLDYSTLDEKTIIKLKKAGVRYLNFTLGTVNDASRQTIGRAQGRYCLDKVLGLLEVYGLDALVYFICGIPGLDVKGDIESLKYLAGTRALIGFSAYYPVSEAKLFGRLKNMDPMLFRGSAMHPFNDQFSTLKLVTFFKITRLFNYLRKYDNKNIFEYMGLLRKILKEKCFYYMVDGVYHEYPTDKTLFCEFSPALETAFEDLNKKF